MPDDDIQIGIQVDAREVASLEDKFRDVEKETKRSFQRTRRATFKELQLIGDAGERTAKRLSSSLGRGGRFRLPDYERVQDTLKRVNSLASQSGKVVSTAARQHRNAFEQANQAALAYDRAFLKIARNAEAFQSTQTRTNRVIREGEGALRGFQSAVDSASRGRRIIDAQRHLTDVRSLRRGVLDNFKAIERGSQRLGSTLPQSFKRVEREGVQSIEDLRREWSKNLSRIENRTRGTGRRLRSFLSRGALRLFGGGRGGSSPPPEFTSPASPLGPQIPRNILHYRRLRRSILDASLAAQRFETRAVRGLRNVGRRAQRGIRIFRGFGRVLRGLHRGFVLLGGAAAGFLTQRILRGFLNNLVSSGKRAELAIVQLATLFRGTTRGAKGLFESIRRFARPLPVTTESVVSAFIRLRSVGVDPTSKSIRSLINASLGLGRPLENVVLGIQSLETESLRKLGINLNRRGERAVISFGAIRREVEKDDTVIRKALLDLYNEAFAGALTRSLSNFQVALDVLKSVVEDFTTVGGLSLLETSLTKIVNLTSTWLRTNEQIVQARLDIFVERLSGTLNKIATPENIDRFLNFTTQFIATTLPDLLERLGNLFLWVTNNLDSIGETIKRVAQGAAIITGAVTGAGIGATLGGLVGGPVGASVGTLAGGILGGASTGLLVRNLVKDVQEASLSQGERQELEARRTGQDLRRFILSSREQQGAAVSTLTPATRGPQDVISTIGEALRGERAGLGATITASQQQQAGTFSLDPEVNRLKTNVGEVADSTDKLRDIADRQTRVASIAADGAESVDEFSEALDTAVNKMRQPFERLGDLLARFNKGLLNFIGQEEIIAKRGEVIRGVLGSAEARATTNVSLLRTTEPRQLNQAERVYTEALDALREGNNIREKFFRDLEREERLQVNSINNIISREGVGSLSRELIQGNIGTQAILQTSREVAGTGASQAEVDRRIQRNYLRILERTPIALRRQAGLDPSVGPTLTGRALQQLRDDPNYLALLQTTQDQVALYRQLNTELRNVRLAQFIVNIDEAFQEGINRGIQGLFSRDIQGVTTGFLRVADTSFQGIATSAEQFLAKQIRGGALGEGFEGLLRNVGQELRPITDGIRSFFGFGGGPGGTATPTQGFRGFLAQSGAGVLAGGINAVGAARQGNVLSSALSGGLATTGIFSGLVSANILTGAAAGPVGLAVAAGIGIIGGILGSIFGRKKSSVNFDLTENLNLEQIRAGLEGEVGLALRRDAISIRTKRTGISDAEKDAIRLSIFTLIDTQIEAVTDVFRSLPNDIFRGFQEDLDNVVFDTDGFDFYKRSKTREKVVEGFEQFVAGIVGAVTEDISTAFVRPLGAIGVRDAQGFIDRELGSIGALEGEARTAQAELFQRRVQSLIEASNILTGNIGIRGSISRARNLSEEFVDRQAAGGAFSSIAELNQELNRLKEEATLEPETLERWKEVRGLVVSIPRQLVAGISQTVGNISSFSEFANIDTGGLLSTLGESLNLLSEVRRQEGVTLEERVGLLSQEQGIINQIISLERQAFELRQQSAQETVRIFEQVADLTGSIEDRLLGLRTGGTSVLSPAQQVATLLRAEDPLQASLRDPLLSDTNRLETIAQLRDLFPQFADVGSRFGEGSAAQRALFRFAESGLIGLRGQTDILLPTEAALAKANETLESQFEILDSTKVLIDQHLTESNELLREQVRLLQEIARNQGTSGNGRRPTPSVITDRERLEAFGAA